MTREYIALNRMATMDRIKAEESRPHPRMELLWSWRAQINLLDALEKAEERQERAINIACEMQREKCVEAWAHMASLERGCHSADIRYAGSPTLSEINAALDREVEG